MALLFIPTWISAAFIREHVELFQLLLINIGLCLIVGLLIYFKFLTKEEKNYFFSMIKEFKSKSTSEM